MLFVYIVNTSQRPKKHLKKMCSYGDAILQRQSYWKFKNVFPPMFLRIENVLKNIVNNHRTKNALCVHGEYISNIKNTSEKHVLSVVIAIF